MTKRYNIHVTSAAELDISVAADYIEQILLNPGAADTLLDELSKKAETLSTFPRKYALTNDPILHSWGVRLVPVKNYLLFYIIREHEAFDDDGTTYIIRFLHSRRDWIAVLHQGITID